MEWFIERGPCNRVTSHFTHNGICLEQRSEKCNNRQFVEFLFCVCSFSCSGFKDIGVYWKTFDFCQNSSTGYKFKSFQQCNVCMCLILGTIPIHCNFENKPDSYFQLNCTTEAVKNSIQIFQRIFWSRKNVAEIKTLSLSFSFWFPSKKVLAHF